MKADHIFDALSGIDEKYIDEAAFELHKTAPSTDHAKIVRIRKAVLIALPSVAAIILVAAMAIPALRSKTMSESAAMAPSMSETAGSDGAAAEAAAEAAEDTTYEYDREAESGENKTATGEIPVILSASYENGIVTIHDFDNLPEDTKNVEYKISAVSAKPGDKPSAEGALDDILIIRDPLSIDITDLNLEAGSYKIEINGITAIFTIPSDR